MTRSPDTVLVLGASGMTGRRITARLAGRGVTVRAGSRAGRPPFRWEDPSTWSAVLDGAAAVYLCYSPDLAVPGAAETVADLAGAATAAGVRRLVLLSGRGEEGAERAETLVRGVADRAGVGWTVVRSSWFDQDFSESFLVDAVRAGVVALPVGGVGEPFVDVEDVADVAVAALVDERHAGQVYEVTGPRPLTFAEATAEIGRATGRDIRFVPISHAEHRAALAAEALPEAEAWLMDYLVTEVLDGRNARTADGVERALGRPPADFSSYVRRTAGTGVWDPVGVPR